MPNEPTTIQRRQSTLSALNIVFGARMQLVFEHFGRESRYGSFLIGLVTNEYLIVRTPLDAGLPLRVENSEFLRARLFTGTEIASFETSVLRQFGAPMVYWHLAYPHEIHVMALRSSPRIPVDIPVQVRGADGQDSVAGRIVDLSPQGAQIVAERALGTRDMRLELEFDMAAEPGSAPVRMQVAALIKSAKPLANADGAPQKFGHGVAFDNLTADQTELLRLLDGRSARV